MMPADERKEYERKQYEIRMYRRQAITAAKDFCYGDDVVKELKSAKTKDQIADIMMTARKKKFGS